MGAPERTDVLWRSPLAARDFRLGFVQRGDFIGMQRLFRGKLQKEAPQIVLRLGGQTPDGIDGLFEKRCQVCRISGRGDLVQRTAGPNPRFSP